MRALILVDIQNDFLPGGALAVPRGDEIIPTANRVQPLFDLVVATQDWHPPDHVSFAARHRGRAVGDVIEVNGIQQRLWPVHCVQDTPGAMFPATLDLHRVARVFAKGADPGVDSYSGFFDNSRRSATGLDDYLKRRDVRDVYLMGLATDYCVKFTAMDARTLDYRTFLIEDGCRGVELNPGDVAAALDEMRNAGVSVIRSDQLHASN